MQPGTGATQGGAADVMEVGDQQHRQTIDRFWGGSKDIRGKGYDEEMERSHRSSINHAPLGVTHHVI